MSISYESLFDAIEVDQIAEEIVETRAACVLSMCSRMQETPEYMSMDDETFVVNSLMKIHSTEAMDIDRTELLSHEEPNSDMMDWDTETPNTPCQSWRMGFDDDLSESEAPDSSDLEDSGTLRQIESEVSGICAASSLINMAQTHSTTI